MKAAFVSGSAIRPKVLPSSQKPDTFLLYTELEDLDINLKNNDVFLAKSKPTSPKGYLTGGRKELNLTAAKGFKAYKTSIWGQSSMSQIAKQIN